MATYYPEGECFFVRSSLKYATWSAEDTRQFYTHILVEYQWNQSAPSDQVRSGHPRSEQMSGKGEWYGTMFYNWSRFYVGESETLSTGNMYSITSHPNNSNWNEYRDRDQGGPLKYILRPIELRNKNTKYLWIDATIPLRAIYFPVAQVSDAAYDRYCTYVVIDFRARKSFKCYDISGAQKEHKCTPEYGLGVHSGLTWVFKVPDLVTYLSIPHKTRNPEYGVYTAKRRTDALFLMARSGLHWGPPAGGVEHMQGFHRDIDLAQIMSATFGVEVGWRPYEFSNTVLDVLEKLASIGIGFIPGAGCLLSMSFDMGVHLMKHPEEFKQENVLKLSLMCMGAMIESSSKAKKYMAPGLLRTGKSTVSKASSTWRIKGGGPVSPFFSTQSNLVSSFTSGPDEWMVPGEETGEQFTAAAAAEEPQEIEVAVPQEEVVVISLEELNRSRGY